MEFGTNSQSCQECFSSDFGFGFNDPKFSDRTIHLHIILPESEPVENLSRKRPRVDDDSIGRTGCSSIETRTIHISTLLLAGRSPFFYKLFSNGMAESNQQHVTLQIQKSEEAAFMDILKFMYTNTLSDSTPTAVLDVLVAADKYEVASCAKYCVQLLQTLPMDCELALLYLDLSSTILMSDTVQSIKDYAKEFLVGHFNDMSKFKKEMLNLPVTGIEAVLSSDDLRVSSEDKIYDFVMNWAQQHYTKSDERQQMLNTRLLRLIRFTFMSRCKLEEVLSCTDINLEHRSKLFFDAISLETPHRRPPPMSEQQRAYTRLPVKVTRFDSHCEECVVYLDIKREVCANLLPNGSVFSQPFDIGGHTFHLMGKRSLKPSFGLFLVKPKKDTLRVEFQFASRKKPSEAFEDIEPILDVDFGDEETSYGHRNLFGVSWTRFIADNSPYFINGVLHLRAEIRIK